VEKECDMDEREQRQQRQQQMRQRISEILDRAMNDPQFRQEWLDNPRAVLRGDSAGPQMPPEVRQLRHQLWQEVLGRAASDQQFRQQLIQDPGRALREGGFGPQLERIRAELPYRAGQDEVRGFWWGWVGSEASGYAWYWGPLTWG
jgi:hypothetical protein